MLNLEEVEKSFQIAQKFFISHSKEDFDGVLEVVINLICNKILFIYFKTYFI